MKRSCNFTRLTSIARTVKGLLNFYLSRKQMPFLKEQKQKAKLARNCPKWNPGASKLLLYFLGGPSYPTRGMAPIPHLPWLGTRCQDGGSPTIFGPCYCNNLYGTAHDITTIIIIVLIRKIFWFIVRISHVRLAVITVLELGSSHICIKSRSIFWQRGKRILVNKESAETIGQLLKWWLKD